MSLSEEQRIQMLMEGEKPVEKLVETLADAALAMTKESENSAESAAQPENTAPTVNATPAQGSPIPAKVQAPVSQVPAAKLTTPVKSVSATPTKPPTSSSPVTKPASSPSTSPVSSGVAAGTGSVAAATKSVGLGLAAAANAKAGSTMKVPAGLKFFNTKDLTEGFFHGCVYGETGVRKTTTAALFGSPEDTLIVLTRRAEQMIPLRDLGYNVALVNNATELKFALMYPEAVATANGFDWASKPNRTLVLDDATEAVAMLLEDNEVIDGKEVKDRRRTYSAAGDDLKELSRSIMKKPMNFVMVALAKVKEFGVNNDEKVLPDLPPSMLNMLITDLEFVFYIKPSTWKLVTERDYFAYNTEVDGQNKTFKREIFAKNKLPLGVKGVLLKEEEMDLKAIWEKIKSAKNTTTVAAKVAPVAVKK